MFASADALVSALRAAAEPSRLRLLALCAEGPLTVSELVRITGQSQPRVSRHLRVLCEAGLLERLPEGSWCFYRLAEELPCDSEGVPLVRRMLACLPDGDERFALDRQRLETVREERAAAAAAYFRANAARWDSMRSLHADEAEVEGAVAGLLGPAPLGDFLDVGTGTGRLLAAMAPAIEHGWGVDLSHEMLAVARANLERRGLSNCAVRQASMYELPFAAASFDAVAIHQVLHFAEDPARAVAEAARVLRPGGRLVVVDFAPHDREDLRTEHRHRRLGFAPREVAAWCEAQDLAVRRIETLPGTPLTVTLWLAERPAAADEAAASATAQATAGAPEQPNL